MKALKVSRRCLQNPPPKTLLPSLSSHFQNYLHSQPQIFDSNTAMDTLSCYSNDWKSALEFFHWVETHSGFRHTTSTFNSMIDILGKFFEFDLSWDLIRRMSQNPFSKPDHATFRVLFKRYVSARLPTQAIDAYFERLEEFGLKDDVCFRMLVDALCEYKHVLEAEELCFGKNKRDGVDGVVTRVGATKIHNMILRGWFKLGWWGKCRVFWEEMDKKGVPKDVVSYSIYMDIVCKSGKPWKAVKLYKQMKSKKMKLDVVAYNTVIRAVGQLDGVDAALKVFREMKELGCAPNIVTFNLLIKLLCENGRAGEAYRMLDQMHAVGVSPNVITYHCFFACLEKPNEILRLFDRMIESGVRPIMDTFVMLMRKFGRWGFLRPVFMLWEKMEELGISPGAAAYNAMIDALIEKHMLEMAKKYDDEMLEKGLSAKPREVLLTALAEGGQTFK